MFSEMMEEEERMENEAVRNSEDGNSRARLGKW
jgi:hypothetical protein